MALTAAETQSAQACALCGSIDAEPLVTAYDRTRAEAADYRYVRCTSCTLVRLHPLPAPAAIAAFYPDEYGPHIGRVRRDDRKLVNRLAIRYYFGVDRDGRSPLLRGVFRALSGTIMRPLRAPHGRNRVLDVGCGSGSLLARYRNLGWSVRGVEMDARACAVCRERGIDVHEGTIFDAPFEPDAFDVILLHHVIEHVLDPVGVLRRIGELLAPGGVIDVQTPNVGSLGFARYRSCWYALDAPRHLMLFDAATLRRVSERAGLAVRAMHTQRSAMILCRSRHYARTQGSTLPSDLSARTALVNASIQSQSDDRLYRTFIGPVGRIAAVCGYGEVLEAEMEERRQESGVRSQNEECSPVS